MVLAKEKKDHDYHTINVYHKSIGTALAKRENGNSYLLMNISTPACYNA